MSKESRLRLRGQDLDAGEAVEDSKRDLTRGRAAQYAALSRGWGKHRAVGRRAFAGHDCGARLGRPLERAPCEL